MTERQRSHDPTVGRLRRATGPADVREEGASGGTRGSPAIKIVHLVTSGAVAGGQLVALQLARAARDRGDDVAFVSPTDGPFVDLVRA
jgi:hypothetical protein